MICSFLPTILLLISIAPLCYWTSDSSVCQESTYSAGDPDSFPGLGRSLGEGKGYPLQYSGLENSMDYVVYGVAKNGTRLSDFHFHLGFPCGSTGKESTCNVWDLGLIPLLGRSPGKGNSYPLQYSGLENSMDSIVHGVAKSWIQLRDFHFHFHFVMEA